MQTTINTAELNELMIRVVRTVRGTVPTGNDKSSVGADALIGP